MYHRLLFLSVQTHRGLVDSVVAFEPPAEGLILWQTCPPATVIEPRMRILVRSKVDLTLLWILA